MKNKFQKVFALILALVLILACSENAVKNAVTLEVGDEPALAAEIPGVTPAESSEPSTETEPSQGTEVVVPPEEVVPPTDTTPSEDPAPSAPEESDPSVPSDTDPSTPSDTDPSTPSEDPKPGTSEDEKNPPEMRDEPEDELITPDKVEDKEAIEDKDPVEADDGRTIYISKKDFVYSKNEQKIYDFLISKCGFNTAAACAVLGNMYMESMLDPEAYGASENAWGLCQWENGRLVQLQNLYPKNWKTLEGQLNYLWDEFNSTSLDPWGPQTYNYLKTIPNTVAGAKDGALYFAKWFERCWSGSYGQRQAFAAEFFDEWNHAVSMPQIESIGPVSESTIKCVWKRPSNAARTALQIFDEDGKKLKGLTTEAETYTFKELEMFKTYKVRMWSIASSGKYSERIDTVVTMENIPNKITASNTVKTSLAVPWVFSLNATVKDDAKLTYKSDNAKVAVSATGKVSIKAKYIGEAKITITSAKTKKYAAAEKTIKVKVIPPKPESLKAKSVPTTVIQATWSESRAATGYQVQWSTDKTFSKGVKSEKVSGTTFNHLLYGVKKNKTYYVRVRNYKTVNDKNYCSEWTKAVKVKITK